METITVSVPKLLQEVRLQIRTIGAPAARVRFWVMSKILSFAAWVGGIDGFEVLQDDLGVVRAGYPSSAGVVEVLLNGETVKDCFAAKEGAFGWVECYTGETCGDQLVTQKRFGQVELIREESND